MPLIQVSKRKESAVQAINPVGLMTVAQFAKLCGRTRMRIYQLIKEGIVKTADIPGSKLIDLEKTQYRG